MGLAYAFHISPADVLDLDLATVGAMGQFLERINKRGKRR